MTIKTFALFFTFLSNALTSLLIAQSKPVTLEEAINLAIMNNKELESYRLKAEQTKKLKAEAFDPGSTSIYYSYDENNVADNDLPLKVVGAEQSFDFPGVYISRIRAAKSRAEVDNLIYELNKNELSKKVSQSYYKILLIQSKLPHFKVMDSLYTSIITAAEKRYITGESNYLESLSSRSYAMHLKLHYVHANEDLKNELQKLRALIQTDTIISVPEIKLEPLEINSPVFDRNLGIMLQDEMQRLSQNKLKAERNLLLPGLSLEYFQGTNNGANSRIYPGFSVGLSIPIFFGAQNARIQAAKIENNISNANALNYSTMLKSHSEEIMTEIRKHNEVLNQYNELGKETAAEILKYARLAYDNGEIDFHTYISSLEEAINIELEYLDSLDGYNQAVLELNYLSLF